MEAIDIDSLKQEVPQFSPRKGWIAFILAFFIPGLGHVYNGLIKHAIVIYLSLTIVPLIFGLTRWITSFGGFITFMVIVIGIYLFQITDAIIKARKNKNYIRRQYNIWYVHLFIAIAVIIVNFFYSPSKIMGVQSFRITAEANEPTIMTGDYVMADLRAYNDAPVKRGDWVLFVSGGLHYTFRIVGMPGEYIVANDKEIQINSTICKTIETDTGSFSGIPTKEYIETFPRGKKHKIRLFNILPGMYRIGEITLTENQYFVMGDFRNNAMDSRYLGPIQRNQIVGKMVYTFWSNYSGKMGTDLTLE